MPENHLLKLLVEKNKNCIIDLSMLSRRIDLTNRAIFVNPLYIRSILSLYVKEKADAIYWLSKPMLFDSQLVYYHRVGLTWSQLKSIKIRIPVAFLASLLRASCEPPVNFWKN